MMEQEIENEMEKALEDRQFYIVVQPKYNSASEKVVGGEALVRWQHPKKGMISPGAFISVFEKNGFIIHLDYYVWEETLSQVEFLKQFGDCSMQGYYYSKPIVADFFFKGLHLLWQIIVKKIFMTSVIF